MKDVPKGILVPKVFFFLEVVDCLGKVVLVIKDSLNYVMKFRVGTLQMFKLEGFFCSVKRGISQTKEHEAVF